MASAKKGDQLLAMQRAKNNLIEAMKGFCLGDNFLWMLCALSNIKAKASAESFAKALMTNAHRFIVRDEINDIINAVCNLDNRTLVDLLNLAKKFETAHEEHINGDMKPF